MRRNFLRLFALIVALSALTLDLALLRAQERELELEKILNPMPDYDPFERSAAGPQFFPNEVDKHARELLIDALTNRQAIPRRTSEISSG